MVERVVLGLASRPSMKGEGKDCLAELYGRSIDRGTVGRS